MDMLERKNRKYLETIMCDSLGFSIETADVAAKSYSETHKLYHNMDHIKEMLGFIAPLRGDLLPDEFRALQAAIIFHDIVYDTKSKTNEEDSVTVFKTAVETIHDPQLKKYWLDRSVFVEKLIMATKKHEYDAAESRAEQAIILADLDRFNEPRFERFWGYTLQLFKEFCQVEFDEFKQGRIDFLDSYAEKISKFMSPQAVYNIKTLIPVLKSWHPTIAVYPGSFNPFHAGHMNILRKAEATFDKVIIAIGMNPAKRDIDKIVSEHMAVNGLPDYIRSSYQVDHYDGMLTDYLATKKYPVTVIRGLRNTTDLSYELNQYRHLQELMPDIRMVSIFCDKDYEHVSSSSIRTFEKYGKESMHKL